MDLKINYYISMIKNCDKQFLQEYKNQLKGDLRNYSLKICPKYVSDISSSLFLKAVANLSVLNESTEFI